MTAICDIINSQLMNVYLSIANHQSINLYEKNTIYNHRALQHIVGRSAE